MAERSKALRSGRSLVLQAWVRIPLLTNIFISTLYILKSNKKQSVKTGNVFFFTSVQMKVIDKNKTKNYILLYYTNLPTGLGTIEFNSDRIYNIAIIQHISDIAASIKNHIH